MNQSERILQHLQYNKNGITALEAILKYGCGRLSARIWDLRHEGYRIESDFETKNGKTYARYRLVQKEV